MSIASKKRKITKRLTHIVMNSKELESENRSDDEDFNVVSEGTASESDNSDQSYLPNVKAAKTARGRGHGQGRGVSASSALSSAGNGTLTESTEAVGGRGCGTNRGRGSQKAKSSGGSNEFTSKASQNKFYNKLSGLDKTALINIIKACIDSDGITMSKVNGYIHSNIDVDSMIQDLEKAKDAVFKALPKPWKYSCSPTYMRNNFAYKRCSSSLIAFKAILRGQVADMRKLNDVDVQFDYILKAWPVVAALPQWIGCCGKDKDMSICLDVLAALFLQVIKKISFSNDKLCEICNQVKGMTSFNGEQGVPIVCQKMVEALKLLEEKS